MSDKVDTIAASKTAEEEVKSKLDGLKATHENNVDKILEAKTKIEARVAEKKAELDSTVQEWKKNREISKLESRADAFAMPLPVLHNA